MAEVAERLERIFEELMVGETVPVRERTRLSCLTWDSLMQLTLVSAIEQEFQISISDEEAIDLNSFAVALQLIQEKLNGRQVVG
ncbi:MAG: acyl carrier protein [Candidatus Omnitrophota bacterium]|nr:acyl carrier protein [Candidatus Omnitrophota bacterium]